MTSERDSLQIRLADESPEVRRRAVLEIDSLPSDKGLALALQALGDDDWRVRKEATTVVAGLADQPGVLSELMDAMAQEENIGLRNAATKALIEAGGNALTEIISRFPKMQASTRKLAVEVIGASGDARAVDLLIHVLDDPDINVRVCAAEWLGEYDSHEAADALMKCLISRDRLLLLVALQSLNSMGASIPWTLLEPLTRSRFYGDGLIMALGRCGAVQAAPVIVEKLKTDPSAARALELLHRASGAAATAVESALHDLDDDLMASLAKNAGEGEPVDRQAATRCLLWSRNTKYLPTIVGLARSESLYPVLLTELQRWGQEALDSLEGLAGDLTGKNLASVVGLLARLLDDESGKDRAAQFSNYLDADDLAVVTAATGAVARFGEARAIPRLLELTAVDDARLRRVAGYALAEMARRYPTEVYENVKDIEIAGARGVHICRVLEVVGGLGDVPHLTAALSSPEPELRRAVLVTLAALAGADAVETIALAMTDEDVGVRMAAAESLGRIGPTAAETIVSALHMAEGPLKAALTRALGRVGHPDASRILCTLCRENANVALAALEASQQLGLEMAEIQDEIMLNPDGEVVKEALTTFGLQVSAMQLGRLLSHAEWDVRLAAVERLGRMVAEAKVVSWLKARLPLEENDLVRAAITGILASTKQG